MQLRSSRVAPAEVSSTLNRIRPFGAPGAIYRLRFHHVDYHYRWKLAQTCLAGAATGTLGAVVAGG